MLEIEACLYYFYSVCTVRQEMKCSRDSEILQEIVCDTTRKSEKHELIRVVSQATVFRVIHISKFPATLNFIVTVFGRLERCVW